jgi:DNA invertase Pin-like site-specific DNA recombinase
MLWAGVVRISHLGGRVAGADNMHADRDQVEAIKRYAARHSAQVEFMAPELGVSGGRPIAERPSLRAAIEGVEAGRYSAIVVAYLSRLTRSRSGLEIWTRVEAAGGHVHCAVEGIDTSTPNGRFVRDIHLANAVREREEHADRFEGLREGATAAGVWQRRQTPLGYTRDPETRRLVIDEEAQMVRKAFADRIGGTPLSAIARDLQMTTSGARALLRNRVYVGELRVGKHVNPAAHPAIVDPEVFDEAQAARVTRPLRIAKHPALLAGLARCAGCSHAMARSQWKVHVYACSANHSAGRCPAPAAITLRLLDEHVTAIALREFSRLRVTAPHHDAPLLTARGALKTAEAEMAAFLRGVVAAGLEPEQFAAAARERGEAVDAARAAVQAIRLQQVPDSIDGDPVAAWEMMNDTHRNRLLGRLIEAVLVARAGGRGVVVPLDSRVRVIRRGSGLIDTKRYRGAARPIVSTILPDLDDPVVFGPDLPQDRLHLARDIE